MANGASLLAANPARIMVVGYPGMGKTGALASLLNAGFKLRILDFDGNLEPLLLYADHKRLPLLDAVHLEDNTRMGASGIEPIGTPTAFASAFSLMDEWKYKEGDVEVNLGKSDSWGLDTVVVLDSLTSMGDAAKARAMKMQNKTPLNMTDRVWGLAMGEQEEFIKRMTRSSNKFHVIVLAHLKMIGPKMIRQGDSPLTESIKTEQASLIETKLFPSALGWALPQTIAQHFPTVVEMAAVIRGKTTSRVLKTIPRPELDVKLPARIAGKEFDISDGLLQILQELSPASVQLVSKQGANE
jgi:hypothetical protein